MISSSGQSTLPVPEKYDIVIWEKPQNQRVSPMASATTFPRFFSQAKEKLSTVYRYPIGGLICRRKGERPREKYIRLEGIASKYFHFVDTQGSTDSFVKRVRMYRLKATSIAPWRCVCIVAPFLDHIH